jgi:hypothetical protein
LFNQVHWWVIECLTNHEFTGHSHLQQHQPSAIAQHHVIEMGLPNLAFFQKANQASSRVKQIDVVHPEVQDWIVEKIEHIVPMVE